LKVIATKKHLLLALADTVSRFYNKQKEIFTRITFLSELKLSWNLVALPFHF
jgi:hypothetical protein